MLALPSLINALPSNAKIVSRALVNGTMLVFNRSSEVSVRVVAETVAAVNVPVKVGEAENTKEPAVPVSSVIADAKLALLGVAKKVAIPVPNPETPVEIGRPVQLVRVPEDGVPRTGVVRVGLVRVLLVSVSVVALPTNVSVAAGKVKVVVPAVAVARTVVVPEVDPLNTAPVLPIIGRVKVLLVKVFVDDTVGTITPSTDITPAEERAIVVSVA